MVAEGPVQGAQDGGIAEALIPPSVRGPAGPRAGTRALGAPPKGTSQASRLLRAHKLFRLVIKDLLCL